ncbi:bifunctional diguanylate cyclase/phosphodiesterase [Achromobacter sp. DH1f]|uniref:putative bifunctional diguanylate cyclase/phosphodiesterase n=1 Tax=Achromobacter sp. DH1f TaxID=1397275 RepID=UPI0009DC9BE2|nr:bifunctional diguanylate cyclase/phosphodiesterase [Achromobacter sp. DH1f]
MLVGHYDPALVVVSLGVAILAAYTALGMANRVKSTAGLSSGIWLFGGAFAMGLGIWSMHFVGMLAFSLPIPLGYDVPLTVLSLVLSVVCSVFALWVVTRRHFTYKLLVFAALLLGSGIAAMHYLGMSAMRMHPAIVYSPILFFLSLVVAVIASGAALWITYRLRVSSHGTQRYRLGAALVMGSAIVGMHYTGMAAAQFAEGSICLAAVEGIDAVSLALSVTAVTLSVLAIALVVAILDARLEARTRGLTISLEQANQELRHLALHDALTGLANRTLLEERIGQSILRAKASQGRFALLFIDLNGFKSVNDAYGHNIGDRLLCELADSVRQEMTRPYDTVARLGGDEFVVLADIIDISDGATIAERLITLLSSQTRIHGQDVGVSASVGIAIFPNHGQDGHTLLINADAAMYHAKRVDRSRGYSYFEPVMNDNVSGQLQLLQDLRFAQVRGEFVLHYQPKLKAPAGPIVGAEALLRWVHPKRGLVGPSEFIPLAERSGLIFAIGQWVLDEACRQMSVWREQGYIEWTVALNLSAMQLDQVDLVRSVRSALEKYQLPASCLTIEITETTAMRNAEASLAVLHELADLGISISIDDFGTGYSSLLYLKRLPASELKIDRGFINQLEHDREDEAIVATIIALGRQLNLKIVAEGVETAAQQRFLTNLGCDLLQGFFLGKPVPADEFFEKHLHIGPDRIYGRDSARP